MSSILTFGSGNKSVISGEPFVYNFLLFLLKDNLFSEGDFG
tara:strand:+ start:173 stop:295 length:123 start_codon:yes stop_codon:yes gene_type:complete